MKIALPKPGQRYSDGPDLRQDIRASEYLRLGVTGLGWFTNRF
jgi:hypothetical protein